MAASTSASPVSRPARFSRAGRNLLRVLDLSPVSLLVADATGKIIYANAAAAALLGPSVGKGDHQLGDLIHPEDGPGARLQFERLARGEAACMRGEHRFRHADGGPTWVLLEARALPPEADTAAQFVLQLTDIELQKKAEEALLYNEQRWNSALESARQGVWDYDQRKDRMFYSRMWRRLRGIPDDEEIGENHHAEWEARIHPDDVERVLDAGRRQGRGDDDSDILEYRERTRNGDYIWILSRGGPIEWDENGKVLRSVGTDTDITRLKTIEQELAAEKERLRVTLEAIADGMISADGKGRVAFMNHTAEQLTGMSAAQARGRPVREVFRLRSERSGEFLDCPVWTCFEKRKVIRLDDDGVLVSRDGTQRDVRCTAAPVANGDGSIAGAVLVFQDVSHSRTLQRQLAHSASHDALTGLTNRAAFEQSLNRVIAAARSGSESSLIYIDLDRFKPVNDTAGHAAGDALLKQVAQTIRDSCRSHDVVARIGGDEFAILLEGCPLEGGRRVAEKIVRAIGALAFSWAGRDYRIGASAGIATIGLAPASPLGFMGEADAACYAAKGAGRGRAVAFADMIAPGQVEGR